MGRDLLIVDWKWLAVVMKEDRTKADEAFRNILFKTEELVDAIKESEAYACYQRRLERIHSRPELYAQFNEFRGKLMARRLEGFRETVTEEVEALYREYSALLNDPLVNGFLMAEQRVCELMRQVYGCIADRLPLDYTYMDCKKYED